MTTKRPTSQFAGVAPNSSLFQADAQNGLASVLALLFILMNPDQTEGSSPESEGILSQLFESLFGNDTNNPDAARLRDFATNPDSPDRGRRMSDLMREYAGRLNITQGETKLDAGLLEGMERDPEVRAYVAATMEAARKYGLDGNLLANQFWQESRFNPNAVSPAGAMGIGQLMPATARAYGVANPYDPFASIDAGAHYMGDLTRRLGDQRLALIAYNGGARAIDFVEGKLGEDVTAGEWMSYMQARRHEMPSGKPGAWQNETFNYLKTIDSNFWSADKHAASDRAMSAMAAHTDVRMATHTTTAPAPTA